MKVTFRIKAWLCASQVRAMTWTDDDKRIWCHNGMKQSIDWCEKKCWNINSKTPVLHCIECNKLNNTTRFTTREKWTLTAVNRYLQTTKKGVSDLRLISILNNNKKKHIRSYFIRSRTGNVKLTCMNTYHMPFVFLLLRLETCSSTVRNTEQ